MTFYVYGGSEFDAKPQYRPPRVVKPFDPGLCGSNAGMWQHQRLEQTLCAVCREEYNAGRRRKWQGQRVGS